MPLDPQAKAVLDQMARSGVLLSKTVPLGVARATSESRPLELGPEVAKVEDRRIRRLGLDIPVRIYTPDDPGPFPILVWFHGGGWVMGSIQGNDGLCRHLTKQAHCMVVSVDYRLAPEAKLPAAVEDCYAATAWMAEHASGTKTGTTEIAVGGSSAGGNLAAAVALLARDKGFPGLIFQLLVCPVIDRKFTTESYLHYGEGYGLTRESMELYWELYLRDPGDAMNPLASPIHAKDLSGLPPALVITAEYDPLRDEAEMYARRLQEAGVPTVCTRYEGMIHGFFGRPGQIDKAKTAIAQAASALKAGFAARSVREPVK